MRHKALTSHAGSSSIVARKTRQPFISVNVWSFDKHQSAEVPSCSKFKPGWEGVDETPYFRWELLYGVPKLGETHL